MADQFDALVSGVPTDADSQRALASQLRVKSALGQMMQMTGDRATAPAGKELQGSADSEAERIGQQRERQSALAQTLANQKQEQQYRQDSLNEEIRSHNMNDARMREQNAAMNAFRTQAEADRLQKIKDAENKANIKQLPAGTFKDLSAFKDSYNSVTDALNNFKPEYAGTGIPGGRSVKNWEAANAPGISKFAGLIDNTDKDAANWYQNYGRNFTIDEMHRLFGARISPTEMTTFEKYHISPNMDADTIQRNLQQIQKVIGRKLNGRLDALKGYDSDQIDALRDGVVSGGEAPSNIPTDSIPKSTVSKGYIKNSMPQAPGMAAPTSQLFPQTLAPQQPNQMPYVSGMQNMFAGLPMGNT